MGARTALELGNHARSGTLARGAEVDDSASDDEQTICGAALRLRLCSANDKGVVACIEESRVSLAPVVIIRLEIVAASAFPGCAPFHFKETLGGFEAIGISDGLSMRLDSDAALGIFLTSAGDSQWGAAVVELR